MFVVCEAIKEYENNLLDLVKLFDVDLKTNIKIISSNDNKKGFIKIYIDNKLYSFEHDIIQKDKDLLFYNREYKRVIKSFLYRALSNYFGKELAWGSLTGIRPARLVYEKLEQGEDFENALKKVGEEFFISDNKLKLLEKIVKNQLSVIKKDNTQCLYIHIPICPTRCIYCSFVSTDFKHAIEYIDVYVEKLLQEIKFTIERIKLNKIKIDSVYVGGGTPSILSSSQLEDILIAIQELNVDEITVECGRADTITKEKLDVLSKYKVNRICINPQTFNDSTLKYIGRNHTIEQVLDAYKLARKYDFNINMDLIAGLPNENFEDFKRSIDMAVKLNPDNITIHTLSIKNAGLIKRMQNVKLAGEQEVEKMLNYSYNLLCDNSYNPYYLYKQKYMLGALENVGYAKTGKECRFNIYSMEDLKSIIACGAGAISKKINNNTREIIRIANVKQIKDYIERFDEMLERKKSLFN